MHPESQLLPMDAAELMHEIRMRHENFVPGSHPASAVQFHPSRSQSASHTPGLLTSVEEQFSEEQSGREPRGNNPESIIHPDYRLRPIRNPLSSLTSRLGRLANEMQMAISRIGEVPPMPPTLRGRFGQFAISLIQRLLWWYTAPLRSFARVTGQLLGTHSEVVEQLKDAHEDYDRKIQQLEARQ
jgi:hypothetical protein